MDCKMDCNTIFCYGGTVGVDKINANEFTN